jgi:hypothetical protein
VFFCDHLGTEKQLEVNLICCTIHPIMIHTQDQQDINIDKVSMSWLLMSEYCSFMVVSSLNNFYFEEDATCYHFTSLDP